MPAQIPNNAIGPGDDLLAPTRALLEELSLLPNRDDLDAAGGPKAAFTGPPQSVALIEAGLTAASKAWAGGMGATIVGAWVAVGAWWGKQQSDVKVVVLGGAAVVSAAALIAISYLIASDLRGRAAAAVATITARGDVAIEMTRAAQQSFTSPADPPPTFVALAAPLDVDYLSRPGDDEQGWKAIALAIDADGTHRYLIVKGSREEVVSIGDLRFR